MTRAARALRIGALGVFLLGLSACGSQDEGHTEAADADLRFAISEGQSVNHFIQQNGISAHLNLRTSPAPRIVVAFPAGNSGAALFFHPVANGPVWGSVTNLYTVELADDSGRALHGMQAVIEIEAESLVLQEADVGSIRFLRKAVDYSKLPARPAPDMIIDGNRVRFSRQRPDGQSSYLLDLEVQAGELQSGSGLRIAADAAGSLRIRLTAASGDPLEVPVSAGRLLAQRSASQQQLEQSLQFLSYEAKLLAGSWRFLTYFGRDTLLSLQLLMPVLTAEAAEIGFGSVFERINARGEVAHEEDIGELAVYRNMAEQGRATAAPIYDYDMIDDNLMLAPVFNNYVEMVGRDRAVRFLSARTSSAASFRSQLVKNLRLVVAQSTAFADDPTAANLLSIKDGLNDGNWRDSEEGLVGGRYPYDVNAVLMPAALHAAANIVDSGLLDDEEHALPGAGELRRMAAAWEEHAAGFFRVSVGPVQAHEARSAYARENGYPLVAADENAVAFYAVALDAGFEPIPVMHSDTGMDLLFLQSLEQRVETIVRSLAQPFPAGLATPIGVLAANPAYADAEAQALVTRNHYHGTVIWSWQQAMMIAGIDAQLRREDLSAALRAELQDARDTIWQGIRASDEIINSELWSFGVRDDEFVIAPFGQGEGHLTESNAVQLWSTVFLALD